MIMFVLLTDHFPSAPVRLRPVKVLVYSVNDWFKVEPLWAKLADSSPHSSFYLSTDWTAAWIETFGELLQPEILVFEEEAVAVGACLLVKSAERRGPFRVRRVYLNTGGEDLADRSAMEFNSVLCRAGCEQGIVEALGGYLRTWNGMNSRSRAFARVQL